MIIDGTPWSPGPNRGELAELLSAGDVVRWHTVGNHLQTTGHHSWGVALLVLLVTKNPTKEMLIAALLHDMAEKVTGDVPFMMKRAEPKIAEALKALEDEYLSHWQLDDYSLSDSQKRQLKYCDMLELYFYAKRHEYVPEYSEIAERAMRALIAATETDPAVATTHNFVFGE